MVKARGFLPAPIGACEASSSSACTALAALDTEHRPRLATGDRHPHVTSSTSVFLSPDDKH